MDPMGTVLGTNDLAIAVVSVENHHPGHRREVGWFHLSQCQQVLCETEGFGGRIFHTVFFSRKYLSHGQSTIVNLPPCKVPPCCSLNKALLKPYFFIGRFVPRHFRKRSATDGTKLDLNIGFQGLALIQGQICNPEIPFLPKRYICQIGSRASTKCPRKYVRTATLFPTIMEVEHGPIVKESRLGRHPFSTSMIVGGRVAGFIKGFNGGASENPV